MATGSESDGRDAATDELRRRLPSASPTFLEAALDNPVLGESEMQLLLRNRRASPATLGRIARDRRWSGLHDVRRGLVRHPRTPTGIARNLLSHLYWKDLSDVAEDLRVPPPVRRHAEALLRGRVDELTLGERIALARRATPSLFSTLRGSAEPAVLRALLENPKLREADVVGIASGERVPGDVLRWIAERSTWGGRRAVRIALASNARTPIPVSMRLVHRLPIEDLRRLHADDRVPRIVRLGADRKLGGAGAIAADAGAG